MTYVSTERSFTDAAARVTGQRYCTHCQCFRKAEGGLLLKAGNNRTRWVCVACQKGAKERGGNGQ